MWKHKKNISKALEVKEEDEKNFSGTFEFNKKKL